MIRKPLALLVMLVTLAFFAVPIHAAPAVHESGTCYLFRTVDGVSYFGTGEYKIVYTSSGNENGECQGQLDPMSPVPDKAINIQESGSHIVITPSGHFSWIIHY